MPAQHTEGGSALTFANCNKASDFKYKFVRLKSPKNALYLGILLET